MNGNLDRSIVSSANVSANSVQHARQQHAKTTRRRSSWHTLILTILVIFAGHHDHCAAQITEDYFALSTLLPTGPQRGQVIELQFPARTVELMNKLDENSDDGWLHRYAKQHNVKSHQVYSLPYDPACGVTEAEWKELADGTKSMSLSAKPGTEFKFQIIRKDDGAIGFDAPRFPALQELVFRPGKLQMQIGSVTAKGTWGVLPKENPFGPSSGYLWQKVKFDPKERFAGGEVPTRLTGHLFYSRVRGSVMMWWTLSYPYKSSSRYAEQRQYLMEFEVDGLSEAKNRGVARGKQKPLPKTFFEDELYELLRKKIRGTGPNAVRARRERDSIREKVAVKALRMLSEFAKRAGIAEHDVTRAIFEGQFNPDPIDLVLAWEGLEETGESPDITNANRHRKWIERFGSLDQFRGTDQGFATVVNERSVTVTADDLALRMLIKHRDTDAFGFNRLPTLTHQGAMAAVAKESDRVRNYFSKYMDESYGRLNPVQFFDLMYFNWSRYGDRVKGFQTFVDYQVLRKKWLESQPGE